MAHTATLTGLRRVGPAMDPDAACRSADRLRGPGARGRLSRRRLLAAGALLGAAPLGAAAETIGGSGPPWSANTAAYPLTADGAGRYQFFTAAEAGRCTSGSQALGDGLSAAR
jgi:hypothetical protein